LFTSSFALHSDEARFIASLRLMRWETTIEHNNSIAWQVRIILPSTNRESHSSSFSIHRFKILLPGAAGSHASNLFNCRLANHATAQHSTANSPPRSSGTRLSSLHSTLHCAQLRIATTSLDATDTTEHHSNTTTEHQPETTTKLAATNPLSQN
jgi:hypothetical protein